MNRKFINSTMINAVNSALMFLIAFIMTPLIVNRLGSEQYGIWVFIGIFTVSGYVSLLDLGMQGTAVKFISEYRARGDRSKLNDIVNSIVFFFISAGVVGCAVLLLVNRFLIGPVFNIPSSARPLVHMLVNYIAVSLLFQFPAMGFSAIIEGMQRYDILRGTALAAAVISNAIIAVYLTSANGIVFLTLITIASALFIAALYCIFARRLLPEIRIRPLKFSRAAFSELFGMSSKLLLSRLIGLIFNSTDKILIGIFLTMSFMTDYDIVNKIHVIVLTFLSIMNQAIIPFTSHLDATGDTVNLQKLFLRATKYAVIMTAPVLIFFIALSSEFITLWVGEGFGRLSFLSQFYLSHCFLNALTGVGATMLVGLNKVKEALRISMVMAAANLLISIITVRYWGIFGLIFGTVLSYTIGELFYIRFILKTLNISLSVYITEIVVKPLTLAAIMFFLLMILKKYFAFGDLRALAVFGALSYCMYVVSYMLIDTRERNSLLNYFRIYKTGAGKT